MKIEIQNIASPGSTTRVDKAKYDAMRVALLAVLPPAPAGLTVVIIRNDLILCEKEYTPLMLSYRRMIDKQSMFNTPPCWNIYILSLVMDWIEEQGGVEGMEKLRN
jgi:phosphoserine aminotransferase